MIFLVAAREIVIGTQAGFWDLEHRYERLSKAGGPLERLMSAVNFEAFRPAEAFGEGNPWLISINYYGIYNHQVGEK